MATVTCDTSTRLYQGAERHLASVQTPLALELLPIHLVVRESTGSSPDDRPGQPRDVGTVTPTPNGQRGRT
jgi:hypothetical protein